MKVSMAEDGEYFSIGSIITCKTCFSQKVEGEVVAFDHQTKMLMLKCPSSTGKGNLSDINIVNLNFVEDVVVKKEANSNPPPLPHLNIEKLNNRANAQIEERQRLRTALASGVSPEGLKLFLAITKTINEVTWQGKNIVVMNQVTISPPYRPEDCKGKGDNNALTHVKKIVEKHVKDQQLQQLQQNSQAAPSRSPQQQPSLTSP
ncbi:protein LSM12 homolog [Limulus polyphemus]|uniref:Protein LSM12 homolog n=1 Tax=Limulus polyphemus TaxID=6850 RepID=A0ABM1B1P1_LIMPO|nr:protein LSM12 homolog [Limulus polyphemus]